MRRWLLLFVLLFSFPLVWALVGGSVSSPAASSLHSGDVSVNLTFAGTANLSASVDNGSGSISLFSVADQSSPYSFTWETANGSFVDGSYNLNVVVLNSTDSSDNTTLTATNVTIDNTVPVITINFPLNGSVYTEAEEIIPGYYWANNISITELVSDSGNPCDSAYDAGSSGGGGNLQLSGDYWYANVGWGIINLSPRSFLALGILSS